VCIDMRDTLIGRVHWYAWHIDRTCALICVTHWYAWHIGTCALICVTHWYAWHISSVQVTWPLTCAAWRVHVCDMMPWCVWLDASMSVASLSLSVWDMNHVRHESWHRRVSDVIQCHARHDSSYNAMRDMTPSYAWRDSVLVIFHSYDSDFAMGRRCVIDDLFICVTCPIHSFMCVKWFSFCVDKRYRYVY